MAFFFRHERGSDAVSQVHASVPDPAGRPGSGVLRDRDAGLLPATVVTLLGVHHHQWNAGWAGLFLSLHKQREGKKEFKHVYQYHMYFMAWTYLKF